MQAGLYACWDHHRLLPAGWAAAAGGGGGSSGADPDAGTGHSHPDAHQADSSHQAPPPMVWRHIPVPN
jgi:hypothetical protein